MLEVTGRSGGRSKKLLDGLKGKRVYWKLKEVALDCSVCGELTLEEAMDLLQNRQQNECRTGDPLCMLLL